MKGLPGEAATSAVRQLQPGDVARVASMLSRAFQDDPLAGYIFRRRHSRRRGLPHLFRVQMEQLFLPAACSWMNDRAEAAALWIPPGRVGVNLRSLLPLLPVTMHIGLRLPATLRLLAVVDSKHPREEHYYLGVIGTEPDAQGHGLGSAVLAPGLARCDRDGLPAYVESSKERNLAFYHRHGFEVKEVLEVPGAPPLWLMWREPQPSDPDGDHD